MIFLSLQATLCAIFPWRSPLTTPPQTLFFPTTTVSKHVLPISHSNCLPGWPTSAGFKRFLPGPVHLLARESGGLYDDLVAAGIRLTPWECPKAKTVSNRRGGIVRLPSLSVRLPSFSARISNCSTSSAKSKGKMLLPWIVDVYWEKFKWF